MIKSTDMVSTGTVTFRADGSAHDTADLVSDEAARAECARVIQAAAAMGE